MKMAPKKVRLCPGCPPKDLELDFTPKFTFKPENKVESKKITIVGNIKEKLKSQRNSLF